jgi:multidrug efflux system membrane fusion protein
MNDQPIHTRDPTTNDALPEDNRRGEETPTVPPLSTADTNQSPKLSAKRPPRRQMLRRAIALLLFIGAALALQYWLPAGPPPFQGRGSAVQETREPVKAATIGTGDIHVIINALGTVTPVATVTVQTQISGRIIEVGFTEGQIVKKGDFLVQVDSRPYELLKAQFEGQLVRDEALLAQAKNNLTRYKRLAEQNSIARQQYEDQTFLVQQFEGTVKLDQAQVDQQALNIEYCHIVSPISGHIGLRLVDVGNYLQSNNNTAIAVIAQLQPITVMFAIPQDKLPQVHALMRSGYVLQVEAYDRANVTKLATGKVTAVDSQIDTTTGTVKLRAEFGNDDERLFPNQFVNTRLLLETHHHVLRIPISAIQSGGPGSYVYLINGDNTVSVRPIKVNITDGDMAQVESGLEAGDRVVIDGADRLRDGAHITDGGIK